MMKTSIFINDMRMHAFHGVLEQERIVGNDYSITIRIGYPFEPAMKSDEVTDTLNYAEVARIITKEMLKPSSLLEHVAGRIMNVLLDKYPNISSICINLKKIAPPMSIDCDGAGVEIIYEA